MELAYPHEYTGSKMTLPLLSKERFCHRSNWMWLHYKREGMMLLPDSGGSGRLLYKLSVTEQISLNNSELNTCLWSDCGATSIGGCDAGRTTTRVRASITRTCSLGGTMEGSNILWQSCAGSCINLCETGWFMLDVMTLLSTRSLQQLSKWETVQIAKSLQRFEPYLMPHTATFIYICYNRYPHPKCFTSPYVPGSGTQDANGRNFLNICYRLQFRWCRRFL